MLHGDETASDIADIMNVDLTDDQKMEQERLLAAQEAKQAELLMQQYEEKKRTEEELTKEEEDAKESINQQIEEQKLKVNKNFFKKTFFCGKSLSDADDKEKERKGCYLFSLNILFTMVLYSVYTLA